MTDSATPTLDDSVRALLAATSQAWAVGDADTFADHYTEDATVALPGVLLEGRAAIRDAMGGAFADALKGSQRTHDVRWSRLVGDSVAVAISRSRTTFPGDPESPPGPAETATWVLVRTDRSWRIAAYHSSPDTVPTRTGREG